MSFSRTTKSIVAFLVVIAAIFAVLTWMNRKKALSFSVLQESLARIDAMDAELVQPRIDWKKIEAAYDGPLLKLVRDTKRFADNSYLHGKITDAITEGSKGYVDAVSAIVLRRTWLRICLFHIHALMDPQDEREQTLDAAARIARVKLLSGPVLRFAREAEALRADANEAVLTGKLEAWQADPSDKTAAEFDRAVEGLLARAVLERLARWRAVDTAGRDGFGQALVLQAEMRQLFHPIYDGLYGKIGREAWTVLTEFTNRPTEMDANIVEKVIRDNLAEKMAIFD